MFRTHTRVLRPPHIFHYSFGGIRMGIIRTDWLWTDGHLGRGAIPSLWKCIESKCNSDGCDLYLSLLMLWFCLRLIDWLTNCRLIRFKLNTACAWIRAITIVNMLGVSVRPYDLDGSGWDCWRECALNSYLSVLSVIM